MAVCRPVGWVEVYGAGEVGEGGVEVAGLGSGECAVVVGVAVVGVEVDGVGGVSDGLVEVSEAEVGYSEVVVGEGVCGV